MTWLSDLSSLIGAPAGGAIAAAAVFFAAVRAEKEANREAIKDIARALRDKSWTVKFKLTVQIDQIFIYTFGKYHFSSKCVVRSIYASLIFITVFSLQFSLRTGITPFPISGWFVATALLVSLFTDYIALLKTRLLLRASINLEWSTGLALIIDVALSLLLAYFTIGVLNLIVDLATFGYEPMNYLSRKFA